MTDRVIHFRTDTTSTACGHWMAHMYGDGWIGSVITTYELELVSCPECLERLAKDVEGVLDFHMILVSGDSGASVPPGACFIGTEGKRVRAVDGGTFKPDGTLVLKVEPV